MKVPSTMPRLKGFRHPREIISYAVWAYHRFAISTADVEVLLAELGVRCCHVNLPSLQVGTPVVDQAAFAADFHASNASSRW